MPTCDQPNHTATETSVVDGDGITACCKAYTSIDIDHGTEYCKCCFAEITGGVETPRTTVKVSL